MRWGPAYRFKPIETEEDTADAPSSPTGTGLSLNATRPAGEPSSATFGRPFGARGRGMFGRLKYRFRGQNRLCLWFDSAYIYNAGFLGF
jgi:hypothetical protein